MRITSIQTNASPTTIEPGSHEQAPVKGGACFATTHWSQVIAAGLGDTADADSALAQLCRAYWPPLYAFSRRSGQNHEDAKDLVQGFFAWLLEKQPWREASRDKGRFRSFLLTLFKGYMVNDWHRSRRLKRGGGCQLIALEEADCERHFETETADHLTPERVFERRWAMTLLKQVLDRLESEFAGTGKGPLFAELKVFLSGERASQPYEEIGRRLGMTEGTLKVTVHRLRQRYRELLRREIANTLDTPEEADQEIRYLFSALS